MRHPYARLEEALNAFHIKRDRRAFTRMIARVARLDPIPRDLSRALDEAILLAGELPDWRLRCAALDELGSVPGHLTRKAGIVVDSLLSPYPSVRERAWFPLGGLRLCRALLRRLEARPPADLLRFEVLMAVDQMADRLTAPRDRQRLIGFVKRLQAQPVRSPSVRWKIADTLHSELHLSLPAGAPGRPRVSRAPV